MIIGLVGKPSSGKSTFFKACTLAEVDIANYPFTTIDKNEGIAYVRVKRVDKEFNKIANPRFGFLAGDYRFVPIKLIDVAGLVKDAHEGKGRGNQFLNDLREADVLIHVVDISGSTNENGEPCEPLSHDPSKDIEFLENEIDMWYMGIIKKGWAKLSRQISQENLEVKKILAKQLSGLKVDEEMVQDSLKELKLSHKVSDWSDDDLKSLATSLRKKTKPIIIAANKIDVDGAGFEYEKVKERFKNLVIIPCSAEVELSLREATKHELIEYVPGDSKLKIIGKLNDKQKKGLKFVEEFLEDNKNTGVQNVLDNAIFELLRYIAIFPGGVGKMEDSDGNVLPDCFLMKENSTALDFAYKIHQDIGDGFIKAIDVRSKRAVGKEHKLKHRDVVEIKTK